MNNSLGYCVLYPESTLKCNREWRKVRDLFANACIDERDRFGSGSVMVWGGNSLEFNMPLVVI